MLLGIIINEKVNSSTSLELIRLTINKLNDDLDLINSTKFKLESIVKLINGTNPIDAVDAINDLISEKILVFISTLNGPLHRIILSYSNNFKIPVIHSDQTQNSFYVSNLYQLSIKPIYLKALADLIQHFNWGNVIYLYNSDDGLAKLQYLFNVLLEKKYEWKIEKIKRFNNDKDAHQFIQKLEFQNPEIRKNILLDCDADVAKKIIIKHIHDIYLGRRNFNYLFTNLIFDDFWFKSTKEFGAINITGLRIFDPQSKSSRDIFTNLGLIENDKLSNLAKQFTLEDAFIHDGLKAIYYSLNDLSEKINETINSTNSKCFGCILHSFLKKVKFVGLTGNVEFSYNLFRQNFEIGAVQMTTSSQMTLYASWTKKNKLVVIPSKLYRKENEKKFERKHVIITSILEEPYLMWRKGDKDKKFYGNERFEGYCKDLADLLMKSMNFTYTLRLVNDSKYGAEDSRSVLGWNGMIGELIRKEADLAIAPLTITSARERVIDFTKPFMQMGISIMIKRPKEKYSDVFSFLSPLSKDIWICVFFSYVAVSITIFLSGKISQIEWSKGNIGVYQDRKFLDDFTLVNCFWFSLGAVMRQNTEISPRSFSARIAGSVWWFFTLIIISSYTANLAAFLTVERMITPINSADDLSKQTDVEYGILKDSSTQEFFKRTKISVYKRMWEYMSSRPHVLVNSYEDGINKVRKSRGKFAFLIESTKNDYVNERKPCDTIKVGRNLDAKGYGIATPLNSPLTIELNLKILSFKELSELTKLENKWWFDRSECKSIEKRSTNNIENSLTLNNVAGCFYILMFGIILSLIVCWIEYYYGNKKNSILNLKKENKIKTQIPDLFLANKTIKLRCPIHNR
uniref:Glutamate receptor 1 n=1 Tax=Polyphagotarsonemus latus TaxID=1204166 RepID=A0AAN0N7A0_9ACAR